ncbi:NAD(P)/FAD-dependent oxidoreductase [Ruminococcaceae bacterium OttesenSCG-928-I18]|nr:NAD(P)/FAD-dependent oxidoreductase [Ruminococcaceae bacterium OttesenSCG-928-I18]
MEYTTDVVVIGAGAIGSAIARELSRYEVDVILIERNEDVGGYASKCNGGVLCSGHELVPGSLEWRLTSASNRAYDQICKDLNVEMKRPGFIYAAQNDDEMAQLKEIHRTAILNGEYGAELLSKKKVHELEPVLHPNIVGGLLIPNEATVDLMDLTLAFVENAMDNGVRVLLSTKATKINVDPNRHCVTSVSTDKGDIACKFAINAAAIYADKLAQSVGFCDYYNYPRTGQYFVLDKNLPYMPKHIVNPLPTPISRGRLVTPTIHGNTLVGPSADNMTDRERTCTDRAIMESIIEDCRKLIPDINPADSITQFCGVRPAIYPAGWRIRAVDGCQGYIEAVGNNQGVSSAPGVAKYVSVLLGEEGLEMIQKENWIATRKPVRHFADMSEEERDAAIKENPQYGNVICRCETVTEGEIIDVIHRGPGAHSVDAIKRRLRAGMGRCQGGFCGPRVIEILARELGVSEEEICKNEKGSEMLVRVNRR